jgi:hypothetical protein
LVVVLAVRSHHFTQLRDLAIAMVPAAIIMVIQAQHDAAGKGGSTAFDPLVVARRDTPNYVISALLLLAFPIVVVIAKPAVLRDVGVVLAVAMVAVGFTERVLLVETGRVMAGNWSWGYFIAVRVLFVYAAAAFLRAPPAKRWRWVPGVVFALHLASGIVYVSQLATGHTYL